MALALSHSVVSAGAIDRAKVRDLTGSVCLLSVFIALFHTEKGGGERNIGQQRKGEEEMDRH